MNKTIAVELGINRRTVSRWRSRYAESGLSGIEKDLPHGGRKPISRNKIARGIIKKTTQERPKDATHWSTRSLAKELGINHSMVPRVWKANGRGAPPDRFFQNKSRRAARWSIRERR